MKDECRMTGASMDCIRWHNGLKWKSMWEERKMKHQKEENEQKQSKKHFAWENVSLHKWNAATKNLAVAVAGFGWWICQMTTKQRQVFTFPWSVLLLICFLLFLFFSHEIKTNPINMETNCFSTWYTMHAQQAYRSVNIIIDIPFTRM